MRPWLITCGLAHRPDTALVSKQLGAKLDGRPRAARRPPAATAIRGSAPWPRRGMPGTARDRRRRRPTPRGGDRAALGCDSTRARSHRGLRKKVAEAQELLERPARLRAQDLWSHAGELQGHALEQIAVPGRAGRYPAVELRSDALEEVLDAGVEVVQDGADASEGESRRLLVGELVASGEGFFDDPLELIAFFPDDGCQPHEALGRVSHGARRPRARRSRGRLAWPLRSAPGRP